MCLEIGSFGPFHRGAWHEELAVVALGSGVGLILSRWTNDISHVKSWVDDRDSALVCCVIIFLSK